MKDFKQITDQLFEELTEELSIYATLGTLPVKKVTGAISSIQQAFTKLKDLLQKHSFSRQEEEIQFFKYNKPRFIAEHYFVMEIFTIETARPLNDLALLKAFYEQELKYIKRFFEQNKFLYTYYQFEMHELDHLLFVRGAKPADIPLPDDIGLDPLFSTCCDMIWGKFIAFERLQEWLREEIAELDNSSRRVPGFSDYAFSGEAGKDLHWTGDTINLVELGYGIWLTGQVNDGNAGIAEIIQWLGVCFKVKLGRPHRRWESIAKRKRVAVTKYTDEMKEAILKRLDEENGR